MTSVAERFDAALASPHIVTAYGIFFTAFLLAEALIARTTSLPPPDGYLIGVLTSIIFILAIVYAGTWIASNSFSPESIRRIFLWSIACSVLAALLIGSVTALSLERDLFMMISTTRWAATIGAIIGVVIGVFEAYRDRLRRSVKELESHRQRLEAREAALRRQNERLDQFTSVVSHDLRNPLNVIDGNLELAKEDCDSRYHDEIDTAVDRMRGLIDDMLLLARRGEVIGDTTKVDIPELVESCWNTVETEGATVDVTDNFSIDADRDRFRQLLENLIRNAVDHVGPEVAIEIGRLDHGDGFYVEDDGPGIPIDDRERVFEVGYTTQSNGTGLGLAIVDEVATAHGWDVIVTDGANGGARFEFFVD